MSINDIITDIIKAEGGSKFTDDPTDKGGRTQYGISEASNPSAWADGSVSEEEARAIYLKKYVYGPHFDRLDDPRLQHFMVDFGVLSGPSVAIECLQRAIGADVDGKLGPQTLARVAEHDRRQLLNRVVIERVKMVGRIVQRDRSQARYLSGWLNRIMEFFEA